MNTDYDALKIERGRVYVFMNTGVSLLSLSLSPLCCVSLVFSLYESK